MMSKFIFCLLFTSQTANAAWWPGMIYDADNLPVVSKDIEVEPWKRSCMEVFQEILEIQAKRNILRDDMNENIVLHKQRKLCKPISRFFGFCNDENKFSRISEKWLKKENKLATKVNARYIQADEAGCFQELE